MIQVNLLPWRKQKLIREIYQMVFLLLFGSVFTLGAVTYATDRIKISIFAQRESIDAVTQANDELDRQIDRLKADRQRLNLISERLNDINGLKRQTDRNGRLLILLAEWLPDSVWLDKVSVHQQKAVIEGNGVDYHSITTFTERLRQNSDFKDAQLIYVNSDRSPETAQPPHLKFKLEAIWI